MPVRKSEHPWSSLLPPSPASHDLGGYLEVSVGVSVSTLIPKAQVGAAVTRCPMSLQGPGWSHPGSRQPQDLPCVPTQPGSGARARGRARGILVSNSAAAAEALRLETRN